MLITIVGSSSSRSLQFLLFLSLIFISGLAADDPSASSKRDSDSTSIVGLRVLFVCIGLVAAVAVSLLLYKFWQKKKRAEQHARLLKLFEDDDELEVELGIRD